MNAYNVDFAKMTIGEAIHEVGGGYHFPVNIFNHPAVLLPQGGKFLFVGCPLDKFLF